MTKFKTSDKSGYNIPPRKKPRNIAPKRAKELKKYSKIGDEVQEKMKRNEKIYCIFCGAEVTKSQRFDKHHLMGREGKLLLNDKYLFVVHTGCHQLYHNMSAKNISWFPAYIERVSAIDKQLSYRESFKLEK